MTLIISLDALLSPDRCLICRMDPYEACDYVVRQIAPPAFAWFPDRTDLLTIGQELATLPRIVDEGTHAFALECATRAHAAGDAEMQERVGRSRCSTTELQIIDDMTLESLKAQGVECALRRCNAKPYHAAHEAFRAAHHVLFSGGVDAAGALEPDAPPGRIIQIARAAQTAAQRLADLVHAVLPRG